VRSKILLLIVSRVRGSGEECRIGEKEAGHLRLIARNGPHTSAMGGSRSSTFQSAVGTGGCTTTSMVAGPTTRPCFGRASSGLRKTIGGTPARITI
jgi:hypothetical protein